MFDWQSPIAKELLEGAPEGIVVGAVHEGGTLVEWANQAFERMSGYALAEIAGKDLRILQGDDRDQEGRTHLRQALAAGECGRALLRNYRKDGSQYWVELLVQPLRDGEGRITHWAGWLRDMTAREKGDDTRSMRMPSWVREDRLTGFATRQYFEELFLHDWNVAERDMRPLTIVRFDIDALGAYNDTFGRAAGDACIKRVAGVVGGAFRRGSDLLGRWEGGTLVVLARNTELSSAEAWASAVTQRVYAQRIRHPRAHGEKVVTVSAGVAAHCPQPRQEPSLLMEAARLAMLRARQEASGRVGVAGPAEFAGALGPQVPG